MYKVDFTIVAPDSPINRLSKAFPDLRFVSLGSFDLDETSAEEFVAIGPANDDQVKGVLEYLATAQGHEGFELLERAGDRAFVRWQAACEPETFSSRVVAENHCFKIGGEAVKDGQETWSVGCASRAQAEQLLRELGEVGELIASEISEATWDLVLGKP
jgi:predicted DNA binding protein